eukprot:10371064-Karenia_brevis.AAC.1
MNSLICCAKVFMGFARVVTKSMHGEVDMASDKRYSSSQEIPDVEAEEAILKLVTKVKNPCRE